MKNYFTLLITIFLMASIADAISIKSKPTNISVSTTAPIAGAPLVLYTDIDSGPISGGENNKGIYITVFGKNFGTSGLGTTVKVFINNVEVDNYRAIGVARGRTDIQQISVQVGALGNPTAGTPLPIKVVVNGVSSNTDKTFTVNSGNIYFVNNVSGVDTADTTTGGTFAAPFRTVQKKAGGRLTFAIESASVAGAWGRVKAGDFIVMRGTGTPWVDHGYQDYFLQALNKSGSAVGSSPTCSGCTGSGPITIMGYPTEDVFINNVYDAATDMGAISGADSARIGQGMGAYINVVNLRIESGNHDGAVNTQAGGSNWRVVNNELTCATAVNNSTAKGGGIAGDGHGTNENSLPAGPGHFYVGNYIHDVFNGPDNGNSNFENHGIYIDGSGKYEIAYNRIVKIRGGNGIQTYANGTQGNNIIDNLNFHHNIIQNTGKHGINIANGARNNFRIWNNIVLDTDLSGIRFNSTDLVGAKVYNNTFYNVNVTSNPNHAVIANDANLPSGSLDFRNNILNPHSGSGYVSGGVGLVAKYGTFTNNLFFGSTDSTSFSSASVSANPMFVAPANLNFALQSTSPAIDVGSSVVSSLLQNDYSAVTLRPSGAAFDIGAFEFKP